MEWRGLASFLTICYKRRLTGLRIRMLVIAEGSRLLLPLPCPPEQFHYGFGLEIFLALELVAEVGDERRANCPIERHAGRRRIGNRQQVFVEPPHFAIRKNADLNGGEDIRDANDTSGDPVRWWNEQIPANLRDALASAGSG